MNSKKAVVKDSAWTFKQELLGFLILLILFGCFIVAVRFAEGGLTYVDRAYRVLIVTSVFTVGLWTWRKLNASRDRKSQSKDIP